MRIPVNLDRTSSHPLATQLADQLRDAIRQSRIPVGARLPSSRALADQLGLARNTVVRAYETLTLEGLVESRAASGFFATRHTEREAAAARLAPPLVEATSSAKGMPLPIAFPSPLRVDASHDRIRYDFVPARPSVEMFPVKAWRRLLQGCLSYGGASGLSGYGDPAGLPALCAAIAAHLSVSRGIVADPAQVLIVGGVQEGLHIVARLFLSPGATVVIENPCYQGASLTFAAAGARVLPVDVDEDGLATASLPEGPAALLYVTPAHQYPTGHTLSMDRRRDLIAWARRNGCYLLEDDYDGAFQYDGSPLQALAGMAPDCTIHLGTFSTTLGAGLRLGYIVAPPPLVEAMRATKALLNNGNPWLEQAVLAEFIRSGSYATFVTRCCAHYKDSRDALLGALRRHFGTVDISGEAAGLHVLWRLPAGVPEATKLEALARRQHVRIYSLASAGACELGPSSLHRRSLVLGYAGLTPKQIEQGIARLSDAVDDTLDDDHEFVRELLLDQPIPRRPPSAARLRAYGRRPLPPRQQPAIRTLSQRPARAERAAEELRPMRIVRGIYRYPVKGLSPQPVRGIELESGKPFPFDRVFALARPAVPIDPEAPRWAKKGLFLMLMLDETLASVQTHLDVDTMQFTVLRGPPIDRGERGDRADGRGERADGGGDRVDRADGGALRGDECVLRADLNTSEGRQGVEAFFRQQVPKLQASPRLVHSRDGHFMDKPDNVISCINLATVRSLEAEWGRAVHPLRFRANFYIDGARAWEEFDWIGSDIRLGDVLFRVDRRNGRCGATNVNPMTGERDMDIPGSLRKQFGHKDLGIYLVARTSGKVVVGDDVTVPDLKPQSAEPSPVAFPQPGRGSFICRGCYYIYDETKATSSKGEPTPFAAVGEGWSCPDCGTGKSSFRPYLADMGASDAG